MGHNEVRRPTMGKGRSAPLLAAPRRAWLLGREPAAGGDATRTPRLLRPRRPAGGIGVVSVEACEGPEGRRRHDDAAGTRRRARPAPRRARRAPRDGVARVWRGSAFRGRKSASRRAGARAARGARRLARHRRRRPCVARGGPRRREEEAVSAARRRLPHLGDGFAHGRLHLPEVAAVEPRPRRPRRGPSLRRPQLGVPQERELFGGAAEELMSAIRVQDAVHPQKTRQSIAAQRYVSRQGHLVWALRRLRTCGLQHG